jgi:HlyD family secretion protein
MAVIADMSELSFTINVDELDIAKVKAGQQAIVTVDALSGQVFSGVVDNVGILGTSSNGVTTYPVKVRLEQTEGLWPGMNATATIVVDSAGDVLRIPVTAVVRGNLALVKGATAADVAEDGFPPESGADGNIAWETNGARDPEETGGPGGANVAGVAGAGANTTGEAIGPGEANAGGGARGIDQSGAPEGAAYVRIETGLNNDSFIEVKSGLSEGDVVLVAATQGSELQQNTAVMMPGMAGMGGGMGGGAPEGGGMPPGGAGGAGGRPQGGAGGGGNAP